MTYVGPFFTPEVMQTTGVTAFYHHALADGDASRAWNLL
jgi:hypothetical protein